MQHEDCDKPVHLCFFDVKCAYIYANINSSAAESD